MWQNCGTLTYSTYSPANGAVHNGTYGSTVSIAAAPAVNEGSVQNFVVTMSPVNCVATTFTYSTANGTAVAPTNYTAVSAASATIAASAATTTVTVTTVHDGVYTPTLYDTVSIGSFVPADVIVGAASANGNIINTDVMPTINIGNITPNAGSPANFVVTLSGPSSSAITFNYATSNGTAVAGTDYTSLSGSATLAAGSTTLTLPGVTTQNSSGGKTLNMTLSAVSGATSGTLTGVATMFVVPTININSVSVLAGSTANFVATLSQATTQAITFNYATANTTAIAGTDYTAVTGTATIAAGATTFTMPVSTNSVGAGKTFSISLNTLVNVNAGTIAGVGALLTGINVAGATPDAGSPAYFVVTINPASATAVTFNYATVDGTAVSGADYTGVTGSATIAAGATTATIGVNTNVSSGGKSFTLTISSLVGAQGGTLTNTATMFVYPSMSINSMTINAGNTANFVVTLSAATAHAVTFNYTTGGGTAVPTTDYAITSGSATINAGVTTLTLPVTTNNSGGGKNFQMTLSSLANASAGTIVGTASLIIVPTVNINSVTASAGSTVNFVATLSQATTQALTFGYTTGGGTATSGTDYTASIGTATILAGATTFTMPVTTFLSGAGKTFNMTMSTFVNVIGGTTVGTATLQPTVNINNLTAVAGSPAPVVVSLNTSSALPVVFNYATANGTATAGTDYTAASGSATIAAGATSTTINVTNAASSAGKNFTMTISGNTNSIAGTTTATISMVPQANIAIPATVNSGSTVNFVVTLSTPSALATTFNYTTSNGTAVSPTNYTATSGTATIAAGATTATIPVSTSYYSTGTTTKNFTMTINSFTNALGGTTSALATLDLVPTISFPNITPDAQIATSDFVVTLSAASANNVVFNYATANGGATPATAGTDYTAASGAMTILAGATTATMSVTTVQSCGGKTFLMNLTGITNATVTTATSTAIVFITPTINIAAASGNSGTNLLFVVSLSQATTQNITFHYATSNGTANSGNGDYNSRSGNSTITAGTTTIGISVPANCTGGGNYFNMTLSSNTHSVAGTLATIGTINIPVPSVSITNPNITINTSGSFVVSASTPANAVITFNYATADGTGVAPTDYTSSSGTATMAKCTKTFTLPAILVGVTTGKTFTESISSISATATAGSPTTGTATTVPPPSISINNVSVNAGANAIFTATLSGTSTGNIVFNYATADGTDSAPSAYTATSGTRTILAGNTTTSMTIPTVLSAPSGNFTMSLSSITGATSGTLTGTGTITAVPVSPSYSRVSIAPNTIPNDGATTATVTVTLRSATNLPYPSKVVSLASSRGATDTITTVQGTTDAYGVALFTVKSSTAGSNITLTATDSTDSLTISQTATLNVSSAIKEYVYVANQASAMSGFSLNLGTGALTSVTLTTPPSPKAILAAPSSAFIYTFDGTNVKSFAPAAATGDTGASVNSYADSRTLVAIEPSGKGLFTAGGGTVYPYSVNTSTGALTAQSSVNTPSSTQQLVCDSTAQYLFVGDNNNPNFDNYIISGSNAALTSNGSVNTSSNPNYLAAARPSSFGPIVIAGYTTTLQSFKVNSSGTLTSIGTSGAIGGTGNISSIVAHPNNQFVYAVNSTKITLLTINQTTGALTVGANYSVIGSATHPPGVMTIDPTGAYLILSEWAGSGNTQGYVGVFSINSGTGALTEVTGSPFTRGTDTSGCTSACTATAGVAAVLYP